MGPQLPGPICGQRHWDKALSEVRRNELMYDDRVNYESVFGVHITAPK